MAKTQIYLIRHGESQANEQGIFLGQTDMDLTDKGRQQAKKTAEYLRNVKVDVIYSSDLSRAYHTAEATAAIVGLPIIKEKALREISCGEWDRQPFSLLKEKYPQSYQLWLQDIGHSRPDSGESVKELQERIVEALKKIVEENIGKSVFVFTHATPIRVFAAFCENKKADEIKYIPWATNASVTSAEYENGKFRLTAYSFDDFMEDILTALPDNV